MDRPRVTRSIRAAAIVWGLVLVIASCLPSAHEVPSELTVETYVKREPGVVRVLLRVPLAGMMGIDLPKEGIGYLALDRIGPALHEAAGQLADRIDISTSTTRLAPRVVSARIALPYDTSFTSYDKAVAHLTGRPLPDDAQVYWLQGYFDALLEYPAVPDSERLSFGTRLITLAPEVTTALNAVFADGTIRTFTFLGDPGRVWLDPAWYQTVIRFISEGVWFVLGFGDQWLLAITFLIGGRRLGFALPLVCFGVGQYAGLLTVAYGPDSSGPWVPAMIALTLSVLLLGMAIHNVVTRQPHHHRTAFAFGGATGVMSAVFTRDLVQFAGRHVLTAQMSFGMGVVAGEVLLCTLMLIPISILSHFVVSRRLRTIIVSTLVATVAWNSVTAGIGELGTVQWPVMTPAVLVTASSWLLVLVVVASVLWFLASFGPVRQQILGAAVPEAESGS